MITKAANKLSAAVVVLLFGRSASEMTLKEREREKTISCTFVKKEKEAAASYRDKQVLEDTSPFPNSPFGLWLGSFQIFTAERETGKEKKNHASLWVFCTQPLSPNRNQTCCFLLKLTLYQQAVPVLFSKKYCMTY